MHGEALEVSELVSALEECTNMSLYDVGGVGLPRLVHRPQVNMTYMPAKPAHACKECLARGSMAKTLCMYAGASVPYNQSVESFSVECQIECVSNTPAQWVQSCAQGRCLRGMHN